MRNSRTARVILGMALILLMTPAVAQAHVKWFSDFSFGDAPKSLDEVLTTTFVALAALSVVAIAALVFVDRRLDTAPPYRRLSDWLASRKDQSLTVMRIATGATMLLAWQADSLLVPELLITESWMGWLQFAVALALLFDRTTPAAGVGVWILYAISVFEFGAFHMLDYVLYLGVGYFLFVSGAPTQKGRASGLPILYATLGFSLCWVGLEKIIYPQWSLFILEDKSQLTLGLDPEFFLLAAAFVEFALGYLLIINLLQRPMSLVVTLVFFTTTLIFGKVEIIGHTIVHGALIVFVLEGPGDIYRAPITFHTRLGMRMAFATVNFLLLLAVLIVPYAYGARSEFESFEAEEQTFKRDDDATVVSEASMVIEA